MLAPKGKPGARPGKQQEVESWYRETWLQLYRFVYARLQNREDAEDLAQETYSRVLGRMEPEGQAASREYLFTTALNLIRDRWRRHRVRGNSVALDETILLHASEQDDLLQRAWIRDLVAQLPPYYQQVFELRVVQGYSRAETAARMGKTEGAVRNLQYRAVQMLRDLMSEHLKEVHK